MWMKSMSTCMTQSDSMWATTSVLHPNIFQLISAQLGSSEIDLFASRVNAQHLYL